MLENVPPEILQLILLNKRLDFRDLTNTASTCSYLRNFILKNNVLWKAKYAQRWPEVHEVAGDVNDYHAEIRHAYEIRKSVRGILVGLANDCSHKEQLSEGDFKPFMDLVVSRYLNGEYIIEYLKEMLSDDAEIDTFDTVPLLTPGNLTLKYYCLASLRFLRQVWLSAEWNEFFSLPEEDQIVETAATMLVQWCRPQGGVSPEDVSRKLDAIADHVKSYLKGQNPAHPLFRIGENVLKEWRDKNIFKNQFSTKHCHQILSAMKEVLCNKMDFCGNEADYYRINNSFITDVLESKRGLPITLSVIYESVARRLGVNLDPISSPAHFLLRFTEEDTPNKNVFYVDVFNKGRMYSSGVCSYSGGIRPSFSRATTKKVIERMSNNIEVALRDRTQPTVGALPLMRSILELNDLLQPYDINTTVYLARFYMTYGMDTSRLEENLSTRNYAVRGLADHIHKMLLDYRSHMSDDHAGASRRVVRRAPEVAYAVGMVMRHRLYDYSCAIYGWDRVCMESAGWQEQMRVDQLKKGANQPFYHVLVDDGSKRYAAQENLKVFCENLDVLRWNEDVGRYFSHFYKNHYVPNCVKQEEYPDDVQVRKKYHLELLER